MQFKTIEAKNKLVIIFLAIVAVILTIFIIPYFMDRKSSDWSEVANRKLKNRNRRLLDGVLVSEPLSRLKPMAVMLENHYDSRPISGLEQASIVYESIVEGDITRFLAIFDYNISAKKIGPVRSARPFFVDLAQEYDSVFFHAGGSPEAIAQLKNISMYNVNEISGDGIYFWRDYNRTIPHNLYISADLMRRAIVAKDVDTEAGFTPWKFKNDSGKKIEIDNQWSIIEIEFLGNPLYRVKYLYNPETNDYTRYLAGNVHKTDQGIILKTKNIILQHVKSSIIDSYGRLEVDTDSRGEAEIFQDGIKISGKWKKRNGRTIFYNQTGGEIEFNRGSTWVELLFN